MKYEGMIEWMKASYYSIISITSGMNEGNRAEIDEDLSLQDNAEKINQKEENEKMKKGSEKWWKERKD